MFDSDDVWKNELGLPEILQDLIGKSRYGILDSLIIGDSHRFVVYFISREKIDLKTVCGIITKNLKAEYEKISLVQVNRFPLSPEGYIDKQLISDFQKLPSYSDDKKGQSTAIGQNTSLLVGEPLDYRGETPSTLIEALKSASGRPLNVGVTFHKSDGEETFISYKDLWERAEMLSRRLAKRIGTECTQVVLAIDDQEIFVSWFWACQLAGLSVIPYELSRNREKAHKFQVEGIFASAGKLKIVTNKLDFFSEVGLEGDDLIDVNLLKGGDSPIGDNILISNDVKSSDIALLLMTSGSSGPSKCVAQPHANILNYCRAVAQRHSFNRNNIGLNWLPLTHVGGLVMYHIRDVYLCCSQVLVETEAVLEAPLTWMKLIDRHAVTNSWAPNFAFSLAAKELQSINKGSLDLSSLEFLLNGGEQVVVEQALDFISIARAFGLDENVMIPSWGMSETCSGVLYSKEEDLERNMTASVGYPLPGISVRVVDEFGNILKCEEPGALQVKGGTVLKGYVQNGQLISACRDGWFDTGDIAQTGATGIKILGRQKDTIIVNGQNYSAYAIEDVINSIDGVSSNSAAVIGVRETGASTDRVVAYYCSDVLPEILQKNISRKIKRVVLETVGISISDIIQLNPSDVPRSTIGKIQKSELKKTWHEDTASVESGQQDLMDFTRSLSSEGDPSHPILQDVWHPFKASEWSEYAFGDYINLDFENLSNANAEEDFTKKISFVEEISPFSFESNDSIVIEINCMGCTGISVADFITQFHEHKKVQELRRQPVKSKITFVLVSQSAISPDPVVDAVVAYLRCLEMESRSLSISTIRVSPETVGKALLEILKVHLQPCEYAIERKSVFIRRYTPAAIDAVGPSARFSDIYAGVSRVLVTGGEGELGRALIKQLPESVKHILVVGNRSSYSAEKNKELEENTAHPGVKVDYLQWRDLSHTYGEIEKLYTEFAEEGSAAGPDMIFHLSGKLSHGPLGNQFPSLLESSCEAKLDVFDCIEKLVRKNPKTSLIVFSSITSRFGGVGVGAHSVSNACLSAKSELLVSNGAKVHIFDWSIWGNIGQSKDVTDPEIAALNGFLSIDYDSGFRAMHIILAEKPGRYTVGVDFDNPKLSWLKNTAQACIISDFSESYEGITSLNHKLQINPPMSLLFEDVEAELKSIWSDLLEMADIDRDSNFFDIGGNSLTLPRLKKRIASQFQIQVAQVDFFRYPTLAGLAEHISDKLSEEV